MKNLILSIAILTALVSCESQTQEFDDFVTEQKAAVDTTTEQQTHDWFVSNMSDSSLRVELSEEEGVLEVTVHSELNTAYYVVIEKEISPDTQASEVELYLRGSREAKVYGYSFPGNGGEPLNSSIFRGYFLSGYTNPTDGGIIKISVGSDYGGSITVYVENLIFK
jgi:hypothetical protein